MKRGNQINDMNDKERLQVAKRILLEMKCFYRNDDHLRIKKTDIETIEWLIEQAERVQKLQQKMERLEKQLENDCFEIEDRPKPKKIFEFKPKVEYGGKLPVGRERE
jgi:hypothetical protein